MSLHRNELSSAISMDANHDPSSAPCHGERRLNGRSRDLVEPPVVWSRWSPTREQIEYLQHLYHEEGIRNPNPDEINQIVDRLKQFGSVQGKNVFYWFQNFSARLKQRHRRETREELQAPKTSPTTPSADSSLTAAGPTVLSSKLQLSDTSCPRERTDETPKMDGISTAPAQHKRSHVERPDLPTKAARVCEPVDPVINYMRDLPFAGEDCARKNSQIFVKSKGTVNCIFESPVPQQYGWLYSKPSSSNSKVADSRPTVERVIPPTLVLFPLHSEGLALKTRQ